MNQVRRKAIVDVLKSLEPIAMGMNDIASEIDTIKCAEEEVLENMPESLKESEKGQAIQNAFEQLDAAYEAANEIVEKLQEIENSLTSARDGD